MIILWVTEWSYICFDPTSLMTEWKWNEQFQQVDS